MASIALPALDIRPPAQQPNLLQDAGQVIQLRNLMQNAPLQTQALQQQVQGDQLENQQRQADLQARQALNQAYAGAMTKDENGNVTFDPDKLQQGLAAGPAAYQAPQVMKGITDFQQSKINLQSSVAKLQQQSADMLGSAASAVKAAGYDPSLAHSLLDTLPQTPQLNAVRAQIDGNPQQFRQMIDSAIQNSPAQQKLLNDQTVASIRANTPEMQAMNAWLQANPGKTAADYQQFKVDQGVRADVAKETDPRVIAVREQMAARENAQKQALRQGDPNAAAQLLVNGDATLSELKARGSTPEFIANTLAAANKLSGGQYNAQQAEASFDVARSPANVAFFGSAKSLTDKGGTLDQLADAAKNIPNGQIPAFNNLADWENAATGQGPIAKYASLALGVADDYAKVMGGGQGTDSSRLQALNLFGAKQSPEQRAASIEGLRGAVSSQTQSRIGNNPILRRMYGTPAAAQGGAAAPQEGQTKTNSHGDTIKFTGGRWVLQQ